jgi:hypothetical protein
MQREAHHEGVRAVQFLAMVIIYVIAVLAWGFATWELLR